MLINKVTALLTCSLITWFLNADESKKQDVSIEKLNNGMMYCLADDNLDDQVAIKLFVKFDKRWTSERERFLSSLVEKLVLTSIEVTQHNGGSDNRSPQFFLQEPELFAVPNLILYELGIQNPSQEAVDSAFWYLSKAFEHLNLMTSYDLDYEVHQVLDNYKKSNLHSIKPRKPFFIDDPLYPGATLDGVEELSPGITVDEVKKFYHQYYRPENMMIVVYGRLSHFAVKQTIENYFSFFVALQAMRSEDEIYLSEEDLTNSLTGEFTRPGIVLASNVISSGDTEGENSEQPSNIEEFFYNRSQAFYDLPISDGERSTIHKIIHTLATHNVVKLLWKKKDLEKMGRTINHVHPLRFLWSILADPKLRNDLHVIRGDFFKWNGFLDGFRRRMAEEYFNNNVAEYVPGFCKEFGLSEEMINHHISKRDWEGVVKASM